MYRKNILIVLVSVVIATVAVYFLIQGQHSHTISVSSPTPTSEPKPTANISQEPSISIAPQTSPTTKQVKIYLVAIGDEGKSGMKIGCGDSLVPVTREVSTSTGVLQAALQELLSSKDRNYGQSGLYNALYQSNLRLNSAVINDGVATVHISGTVQLGGACDDPRFVEQIRQTVLQFPTVQSASIYINNKALESYGTEK